MDASTLLWERWRAQVKELFPAIHGHQKKTLALFVLGIVLSGSAVLQRVAESVSLHGINPSKMTSIERRFARFIANDRVVVSKIWDHFLSEVLPFWNGKPLRFVLDCTPFRSDATIVYLGLLVHSRVLPVAWAVMPATEKWEEKQWSIVERLLDRIIPHLASDVSGSWICCVEPAIKLTWFTASLFASLLLDGTFPCAFKMCQGESTYRPKNTQWALTFGT